MPQKQKPLAPGSANGPNQKQNDQADYLKQFAIVPIEIIRDRNLKPRQRVVLEALMSFRKARTGTCYGTLEQIAERCGLSPYTVSRTTNQIAKAGYISIKRNSRGCNDYRFSIPFHDWQPEQDLPESGNSKADPDLPESGNSTCHNPATRLAGKWQPSTDHNKPRTDHVPCASRLKPEDLPAALPPHWREALRPQRLSDEDEVYADFRDHATHKGEVLNNAVKALLGFASHKQGSAMDAVIIEKTRHWL